MYKNSSDIVVCYGRNTPLSQTNYPQKQKARCTGSAMTVFPQRPRLPPELVDIIIDLLHTDQKTLATCALVCKSWVPASRHHLFLEITLSPVYIEAYCILSSPVCTIAAAVQYLVVETIDVFDDLHEITSRLSNTTHLTLCGSYRWDAHSSSLLTPSPFMKNLGRLDLSNIHFDTAEVLLSLLRHCPRLQSLYCYGVSYLSGPPIGCGGQGRIPQSLPNDQDAIMPELKMLEVHKSYWLLDCVYWGSAIPRLTTLNLDLSRKTQPLVERLLDAAGSSLQDLRLANIFQELCEWPDDYHFLLVFKILTFSSFAAQRSSIATSLLSPNCGS
jgi:hypothetical protein